MLNHCPVVYIVINKVAGNHVQDLLTKPSCKIDVNERHNWCFLAFYKVENLCPMSKVGIGRHSSSCNKLSARYLS